MQIRIRGYSWSLSSPYASGTILTKAEAQALNTLRAENIQNNLRGLVDKALAGLQPGELLAPQVIVELQTKISNYDHQYRFPEKHEPRPRLGDIESEAQAIAQEAVQAALVRADQQVGAEELAGLVALKAQDPAVLAEARDRVAARRRALSQGLDSL